MALSVPCGHGGHDAHRSHCGLGPHDRGGHGSGGLDTDGTGSQRVASVAGRGSGVVTGWPGCVGGGIVCHGRGIRP